MARLSNDEEQELLELVEKKQRGRGFDLKNRPFDIPFILLPYQIRWHQDMSAVRIMIKSRRIGGTWGCLAAESALEAAAQRGMDQFYVGYNREMAAEYIGDCAFFARAYQLAASKISVSLEESVIQNERQDIVRYAIRFASGHQIVALSSRPSNMRGHQGHARIDEAAFHDDLQELVDAAMAFLIWGGRVDIVSTHFGEENVFNQIIQEVKRGKLKYSIHRTTFDEALAEGFYQRVCLIRGIVWTAEGERAFRDEIYALYGAAAEQELGCVPANGSGAYFARWMIERCQDSSIPVKRFSKPAEFVMEDDRLEIARKFFNDEIKPVIDAAPTNRRTVYGQDFGRDGDLSVIWILQADGLGTWRTMFILELRKIPFDVQALLRDLIIDELPLFHHAKFDARGNGQSHAEGALQKYGEHRIDCVMATAAWYAKFFPKYKTAYEDKAIVVPESEDVIADHRRVVLEKGSPKMSDGRDKGSDGGMRHGDTAIAGVLAWAATEVEGEPAAGSTVNPELQAMLPTLMQGRRRTTMFR